MSPTTSLPRTRLQEILDAEGRKQTWLAAQIGVTRAVISSYANGLHVPDDKRPLIAKALGRTVKDVFGTEVGEPL
jgi:hypothetical protein